MTRWFSFFGSRNAPARATRSKVGLVLGGGAVRGAAHIGVLSVLESAGVKPSVVAGTSVGAIVGAGISAGLSAEEMWEVFRALDWRHVARPSWHSKLSMFQADPLAALIAHVMKVERIDDLAIPFAAVSCDLLTGRRVVNPSGDLAIALTASAAIPVMFEPIRHDGMMLVDGGVVDNLPVDIARDLGADYLIAVDIMPALDGGYVPTDIRDVSLMTFNIVEHNTEEGRELADVVITPDVARVNPSDFRQAVAAYEAGIAAAEAALPEIRRGLGLV